MSSPDPQSEANAICHVLIVDDHPLVRKALSHLFDELGDYSICGQANGQEEAVKFCERQAPDLAIVDLTLADGDGLGLVRTLSENHPNCAILVHSMHDEFLYGERVLRAGASGFISKSASFDELCEAIRAVRSGEVYVSQELANRVLRQSLHRKEGETSTYPLASLSDRELQVFQLIGDGLNTKAIASQLALSPKTVESYREKLKMKLGLRSALDLTRMATIWSVQPDQLNGDP